MKAMCVLMGLPTGSPVDHATRVLEDHCFSQNATWCRRVPVTGEKTFASAGHAAVALFEMNGISVCAQCASRLCDLFTENAEQKATS